MKGLADQVGELVGVLAHHGHPHRARPVVVEVAQLVGEGLHVPRQQALAVSPGRVVDDVVAGRVDGALPHRLGHQVEVVPEHELLGNGKKALKNIRTSEDL